jgi:DNA-binding NarL/FixJ family response regulator
MSSDQPAVSLVCENRLLREALIRILKRANVALTAACGSSAESLKLIVASQPEVVVLDSFGRDMEDSSVLSQMRQSLPAAKLLMVGMEAHEDQFLLAVREGALGYVLRDASAADVLAAIRALLAGEAVCPACFSATLFRHASQQLAMRHNLQTRGRQSTLSRREQQITELLSGGLTNKEIANRLHLSSHTVKNHIHRILHKTGVTHRTSFMEGRTAASAENLNRALGVRI